MKRSVFGFLLLLLASCVPAVSSSTAEPSAVETAAFLPTDTLPPVLTSTPVRESRTAAASPATREPSDTPTVTWIKRPSPTLSPTPVIRQFDAAAETVITLVRDGWIYAVNLAGELMPLWNMAADELINADAFYMKISPDRKSLAFSGIGADGRPTMEVMDLASLDITVRETFSESRVSDFSWSPSSQAMAAAVVNRRSRKDFGTVVYRIDVSGSSARSMMFRTDHAAVSQIEWPLEDRIAYSDTSCENAEVIELWYDESVLCGKTGLGVFNMTTRESTHREVAYTRSWPGGGFEVSPDKQQLLFYSYAACGGNPPTNGLFALDTLNPLPCSFCKAYNGMSWFGDFILARVYAYCSDYGNVYLLEVSTGFSRLISQFGTFEPDLRVVLWQGIPLEVYYDIPYNGWIAVSDMQSCMENGWEPFTCFNPLWHFEGQWPDSFNATQWQLDIGCEETRE